MNEEERKYYFMRTHLGMSPDEIYRETNIAEVEKIPSLTATSLTYERTYEEELEEQRKVSIAEGYLEGLGVKVKTDMYGYYRNTYDILLDLGEYLDKKDKHLQMVIDEFCATPLVNPISPEDLKKALKIAE